MSLLVMSEREPEAAIHRGKNQEPRTDGYVKSKAVLDRRGVEELGHPRGERFGRIRLGQERHRA
ncbi:MAG TPA: hypothetical protein VFO31_22605, partial [Vicinamibacterales bacterium]|nr:hypothetical protein [Vicinamibacterales bacterium]